MQNRISVRNLVEFLMRSGDIDNRHAAGAENAMQAGSRIHREIQRGMGPEYRAEVSLSHTVSLERYELVIEGRADGIFVQDGNVTVDEIKGTYRGLHKIKEPVPVHLAQAKCYAYMYALQQGLPEIRVRMTYCHLETEAVKYFEEAYSFEELSLWFDALTAEYRKWSDTRMDWLVKRNAALKELAFPFPYRKGQKELVTYVYQTIYHKRKLFLEAPTGVGKTISTMYPALKALGEGRADRLFYLTAKTITRTVADDTLRLLSENGMHLKRVLLTAKEKICPQEETVCNPDACPYAKGHFDRINDCLYDCLINEDSFSREVIERYAEKYRVCPFEMSLDMSLFSDAVICDYNYAFDPHVYLKRFFSEGNAERYVFLIDEAHNLVERGREMYSAALYKEDFLKLKGVIRNILNAGAQPKLPDGQMELFENGETEQWEDAQMTLQEAGQMEPQEASQMMLYEAGQMEPQEVGQMGLREAGQMTLCEAGQMEQQEAGQMTLYEAGQMEPQEVGQMGLREAGQMMLREDVGTARLTDAAEAVQEGSQTELPESGESAPLERAGTTRLTTDAGAVREDKEIGTGGIQAAFPAPILASHGMAQLHEISRLLDRCNKELLARKRECEGCVTNPELGSFTLILNRLSETMGKYLENTDSGSMPGREEILDFYFEVSHFLMITELVDEHYVPYMQLDEEGRFLVKLFCVDPSRNLQECMGRAVSSVLFSATMLPIQYYKKLLGGTDEDYEVYAGSTFDDRKRGIYIADDVTSKYTRRGEEEYRRIAKYIRRIVDCRYGNYMIFFPSHQFLKRVYEVFVSEEYDASYMDCIVQEGVMDERAREAFLRRFSEAGERGLQASGNGEDEPRTEGRQASEGGEKPETEGWQASEGVEKQETEGRQASEGGEKPGTEGLQESENGENEPETEGQQASEGAEKPETEGRRAVEGEEDEPGTTADAGRIPDSDRCLLGFCVLGGLFGEGIDLKRDALIGVMIVGTGLPQVCAERAILKDYFDGDGGVGFDYAYRYPGMNKVLQAAGRVIRTADDVGIVALLDYRFCHPEYRAMFPREWKSYEQVRLHTIGGRIERFWDEWL